MKTTIEIPDDLAREVEARGALAGQSLKDMITEGLRLLLAHRESALPAPDGEDDRARTLGEISKPDITAWDRLRAAYQDPFPGLTTMQMLDEFRGPVELPPTQP